VRAGCEARRDVLSSRLGKSAQPLGFSGTVWSLLGASDGSLWIGGSDHLYRWDGVELSAFTRHGRYDAIVEDRSGAIWAVRERVREDREGALCRPTGATITCFGAQFQLFNSEAMAAVSYVCRILDFRGKGLPF
jgi:hypothetical protein